MKKSSLLFFLAIFIIKLSVLGQDQPLQEVKKLYNYERYTTAGATLHRLLAANPNNAEAWAMLVRNYIQLNQSQKAADSFALAPQAIKVEPYYTIAEGAVLLSKGDRTAARSKFEQAINATKGKDIQLLADIAAIQVECANGDEVYAIELLDKAIKKNKKDASLYVLKGEAYRKQHNGTEAYRAFAEAIEKDSKAALAYYDMGRIFLTQKNKELYTENFEKAIAADPQFSPAYYQMYRHYLVTDPAKSKQYFLRYKQNADPSLEQEYAYTDLLYLTKNCDSAIQSANKIISAEGDSVQPRLYKLISYCLQEKTDTAKALEYMTKYFRNEVDSNIVLKDYETMSLLYSTVDGKEDSSIYYLEKAAMLATESKTKINYYQKLATLSKESENYAKESYWRMQLYSTDPAASNVALFNWGLAAYKAQDFLQADSVFGIYAGKYSDQGFGYYWRARSNAALDSASEKGLAVPHYQKLIEVIGTDTANAQNKKWMKEALGYLGSYEANNEKDYPEAIAYFEKLLELDPANEQVAQSIEILEKRMEPKK